MFIYSSCSPEKIRTEILLPICAVTSSEIFPTIKSQINYLTTPSKLTEKLGCLCQPFTKVFMQRDDAQTLASLIALGCKHAP